MAGENFIHDDAPVIDLENLEEQYSEQFDVYPDTTTPENTGKKHEVQRNPDGTIKKGFSLNPAGRKKGSVSGSTVLRKILLEADLDEKPVYDTQGNLKHRSSLETVVRKLTALAKAGDMSAIKEVFDRLDGKARQSVQIDNNTKVRFNPADYAEMEKLWFIDPSQDETFIDEDEDEESEQENQEQVPTGNDSKQQVDTASAQALSEQPPAKTTVDPEYDSEQDEIESAESDQEESEEQAPEQTVHAV